MKRILTGVFLALLVSILTCGNVWAQAAAQIAGAVSDQSGAVLPGAEITATQVDTGVSRSTINGSALRPARPWASVDLVEESIPSVPGARLPVVHGV